MCQKISSLTGRAGLAGSKRSVQRSEVEPTKIRPLSAGRIGSTNGEELLDENHIARGVTLIPVKPLAPLSRMKFQKLATSASGM